MSGQPGPEQPDLMARRAFLRRLGTTAAFVLPVVTSFSMSSVSEAFGAVQPNEGDSESAHRNHTASSNTTSGNGGHHPGLPTGQRGHSHHHHHPNCNNDPNPNSGGNCGFSELD